MLTQIHSGFERRALGVPTLLWTSRLAAADLQELRDACEQADGYGCVGEELLARLDQGCLQTQALEARWRGRLVGYAHLRVHEGQGRAELAVHPDCRNHGVGTRLLAGLKEQAQALGAARLELWSIGHGPAAAGFCARHGLKLERRLHKLRRACHRLPEVTAPLTLRPFENARDRAVWFDIHRAVQRDPAAAWSHECLDLRMRESWFDPQLFLMAESAGQVCGYVWLKQAVPQGELFMLAVAPRWQGQGLGRNLAASGMAVLAEHGARELVVYVDGANTAGFALYAGLGFTVQQTDCCHSLSLA